MKYLKQEIITRGLDKDIVALRVASVLPKPTRGWLRAVRDALGLSQKTVAEKAGIRQQAVVQWETREVKGTITLESLERAATAMGCNLVYYLVPKPEFADSFAALSIRNNIDGQHRRAAMHSMALEGQAVVKPTEAENKSDPIP